MQNRETVVREQTNTVQTTPSTTTPPNVAAAVDESPHTAYRKKKAIFRYYQAVWYILGVIETVLIFRFLFKLIGANPDSGIVALVYNLSAPFAIPFIGVTSTQGINNNVFEFTTLIAMLVYLVIAWGIVKLAQFIKPTSAEEVEVNVDQTV
jgi:hypothetical protein